MSLDSVGINQREVVMIESSRKGVATILTPSHARAARRKGLSRSLGQGHMQAGYPEIVSSEIAEIREPSASGSAEGNPEWRAIASA